MRKSRLVGVRQNVLYFIMDPVSTHGFPEHTLFKNLFDSKIKVSVIVEAFKIVILGPYDFYTYVVVIHQCITRILVTV